MHDVHVHRLLEGSHKARPSVVAPAPTFGHDRSAVFQSRDPSHPNMGPGGGQLGYFLGIHSGGGTGGGGKRDGHPRTVLVRGWHPSKSILHVHVDLQN